MIIAKHKERHKRQRLNHNQNNVQLKQQRQHKQQRHQQPKNEQNRFHSLAEIGNQQRREHQRRARVVLQQNERRRQKADAENNHHRLETLGPEMVARHIFCQRERCRNFGELGRLHLNGTQHNPRFGAVHRRAENQHREQNEHQRAIDEFGKR